MRSEAKAPLRIGLWALLLAIAVFGLTSAPAFAASHVLTDSFGSPGSGAGQLNDPKGIAVDQSTGDIYVADTGNRRVSKFDSDGDFLFSWGIDVVKSGPDNGINEHQSVTVEGSGGTFGLRAPNAFDPSANRHQTVLVEGDGGTFTLRAPNGFDPSANRHQTVLVRGDGGTFILTAPNGLNPDAPDHWAVSPGPNPTFFIQVGDDVTPNIPQSATAAQLQSAIETLPGYSGAIDFVTGPAGGPWDVTFEAGSDAANNGFAANGASLIRGQITTPLPRNASAAQVQTALQALSIIGANVSVAGSAGGPWDVEFTGIFAGEEVAGLGADGTNLTGTEKTAQVHDGQITTPLPRNASAAEVQTALQALSIIGANVSVTGPAGGPWDVEFTGALASKEVPGLGADGFALTGTVKSAFVQEGEPTTPLPGNASAAEVQAALQALDLIGANVTVTGSAGGPWDVEFTGVFAQNDVPQLAGDALGLSGDPKSVMVATTTAGGGLEICKAGVDVCKAGAFESAGPVRFSAPIHLVVDNSGGPSSGNVYVGDVDLALTQKFDASGGFIAANDGSASGGFPLKESFAGLAIDGSGNLYMGGRGDNIGITKFTQNGSYITKISKAGSELGLSIEPSGQHIFINFSAGDFGVIKFNPQTSKFWNVAPSGWRSGSNLSLDPSDNTLYVSFPGVVKKYDPSQNTVNLIEEFGVGDLDKATAVSVKADEFQTTYVTDAGTDEVKVFASPILPDPKTGDVTNITESSATVDGTVNPNGVKASYEFEYVDEETFLESGFASAIKAPIPAGDAGEGEEPVEVSAELTGLEPETTYRWRLSATNDLTTINGATKSFSTPRPVVISGLFPSGVSTTSGVANATINPGGSATTYQVEYGTTTDYGSVAPVSPAGAGSGTKDLKVSQALQGLKPDTTYHFRFVAENVAGPVASEDRTLHTFPVEAPGLPDGRAWEMVSPVDKNGGNVTTRSEFTRVAEDGNAVVFSSAIAFAGSLGTNGYGNEYIAKRGSEGWDTHGITPLQIPAEFPFFSSGFVGDFSANLDRGVFLASSTLAPGSPNVEGTWNLYAASNLLAPGGTSMQLLSDSVNPASPADESPTKEFYLAATSEDLDHVIFESRNRLTPDSEGTDPTLPKLYESVNGEVRLVGILPDDACGSPPCVASGSAAGRGVTENPGQGNTYTTHTISEDGSRIFFTAAPFTAGEGFSGRGAYGTLYMREDGTTTVPLNVSERTDCNGDPTCGGDDTPDPDPAPAKPAKFLDATPDGSMVFSVTDAQLNDEDTNNSYDVYRYEVGAPQGERLTLISKDENPEGGANAAGYVVGTSEDGSYVYFTGANELVPGQPSVAEMGSGKMLFAWHDGEVRFVGVGPGTSSWGEDSKLGGRVGGGALPSELKGAATTPDGRHLVFPSWSSWLAESVAGFSNDSSKACKEGDRCQQLYAYDYGADELECASCLPSKEAPTGDTWPIWFADQAGSGLASQHLARTITDDGRWVFFSSPDRLVFRDTNGRYDAYRYDTTTGKVALLSSGTCSCDSYFVESSPDGEDVFFTTREQLVAIDIDNSSDLYDARVGGGIAAQHVVPEPQCEGDSCQPPAAVPNFPTPASNGFRGAGNIKAESTPTRKRCGAGKARRGKRCVAKRKAKNACAKKKASKAKRSCARANRNRGGVK